ncbi:MAG: hypothetical protein U9Q74_09045, partial [Gemmatimonadota bacterium]|nr:hypothetical protein [Gemmatimonadota bacterium]
GALLPRYKSSDAPDYWTLRHLLTWLLVSLPAALLLALAAGDSRMAAIGPGWAIALLFGLATPVLTYASVFFSHIPAALMIGVAWALVRDVASPTGGLARPRAFAAGLLVGGAVLTEYPTILLAVTVGLAVALHPARRRALVAFAAGSATAALVLLAYNRAAWGEAFTTGYAFKAAVDQAEIHAQGLFGVTLPSPEGLWGVLFSARRGFLFYCPMLVTVGLGWRRLWRDERRDTAIAIGGTVAYVAFAAGFVDWQGGWSAACRHLVPVLPLLFVPFAVGLRALLDRPATAALAGVLAGCSAAAALLSIAVTPYFPEQFANPLAQVAIRSLGEGIAFRNVVSDAIGVAPVAVFGALAVVILAATTTAVAALTRGRPVRRLVLACFLVAVAAWPAVLEITSPATAPLTELYRLELLRRIGAGPP